MILTAKQRAEARCLGSFSFSCNKLPGETKRARDSRVKAALSLCNDDGGCPIKEPCLQIALAELWDDNVAGGTTLAERNAMREQLASA